MTIQCTLADISISGQSMDLQYSTVSSKESFLADSRSYMGTRITNHFELRRIKRFTLVCGI